MKISQMTNLPKDASRVSYNITDIPQLRHISKSVDRSIMDVRKGMEGNRLVYPTNWARLNKNLMGGLQPGKMYVVAGRPGVGKSAFSNQLIFDLLDRNAGKNMVVLYWSFEMPGEQQILRAGSKDTKLQTFELLSVEQKLSTDKYDKTMYRLYRSTRTILSTSAPSHKTWKR